MREPLDNKATRPPRNKAVERFPQRVGNKRICDRPLTAEEIAARGKESEEMRRAREFRERKKRERGT